METPLDFISSYNKPSSHKFVPPPTYICLSSSSTPPKFLPELMTWRPLIDKIRTPCPQQPTCLETPIFLFLYPSYLIWPWNQIATREKGSRLDPADNQPVDLTSAVSTIMGRFIWGKHTNHLVTATPIKISTAFWKTDRGYLYGSLLNFITMVAIDSTPVFGVFLDSNEALNRLPHSRLLSNCVADHLNPWSEHYMTSHSQNVDFNNFSITYNQWDYSAQCVVLPDVFI